MPRDLLRLSEVFHVLPEVGEHRADPFRLQVVRRGERRPQVFPRHEAGHRPMDEPVLDGPLAQPAALRSCEKRAPHQTHGYAMISKPMRRCPQAARRRLARVRNPSANSRASLDPNIYIPTRSPPLATRRP